jgi:hypothetical protein
MEAEDIFGESRPSRSTKEHLILRSIVFIDFRVRPSLKEGKQMSPRLVDMSSANVNMGSSRLAHVGQIKKECQAAISVNIVMKARACICLLFVVGGTGQASPHASAD